MTVVDATAPPERLAAFRIALGGFVSAYFALRAPVYLELADRPAASFDPVGVFTFADGPMPAGLLAAALAVTVLAGVATTLGWRTRLAAPVLAVGALVLTTYRSSWGQLLHFEHLFVILLLVIAFAPLADAWSIDARRRPPPRRPLTAYGWPLELACVCVTVTYAIAGIAKLRYGGLEWATGDTLRNHVASAAVRLEIIGGTPSPLAAPLVRQGWLFTPAAFATLLIELAAPLTIWFRRLRPWWVAAAWLMHVAVFATMLIGFPTPLFFVAFLPFFRLETWRLPDFSFRFTRAGEAAP